MGSSPAPSQSLESIGFTLPESEKYLRETFPSYASMKPQDRQSYLQEMHYGPQGKPTGPALGREAALGALGTVLPETQHPLRDAATAAVKDATNPSEIAKTALTSGMYPAVKMGIGLGRQLLHGAGDVAPVLGKLTPGGGFGSTITKDEAERAAHGAGEIGGTIAPAVLPEAVKPVARGAGAALENTGRFANTPLPTGIDRFRNVTPAGVVGGTAGGFIGHHLGVPVIGESGGAAAGMIGATAAAKGAENLGARLREWGGYEPPPVQRDLSGVKPLSRIPKSRMIPDLRNVPAGRVAPPPLQWPEPSPSPERAAIPPVRFREAPVETPAKRAAIPPVRFREAPVETPAKRAAIPPVRFREAPVETPAEKSAIIQPGQNPIGGGRSLIELGKPSAHSFNRGSLASLTMEELEREGPRLEANGDPTYMNELKERSPLRAAKARTDWRRGK